MRFREECWFESGLGHQTLQAPKVRKECASFDPLAPKKVRRTAESCIPLVIGSADLCSRLIPPWVDDREDANMRPLPAYRGVPTYLYICYKESL
jgi:hypothetical protein